MKYIPQLDGLRGLAVLSVIFSHWFPASFQGGIAWGVLGVQLFFVLSGFLITSILANARRHGADPASRRWVLKSFYARRFLRIFPLYYAVVLLMALAGIFSVRETLWWHLTYTSNIYFFMAQDWYGPVAHFWSLAVEEQFYWLWPWVILYVPQRYLIGAVSALAVSVPALRLLTAIFMPNVIFVTMLPFAASDALAGGALLALIPAKSRPWNRLVWGTLVLGLSAWWLIRVVQGEHGGALIVACGHLAMVMACIGTVGFVSQAAGTPLGRCLSWAPLVGCGVISYGLYILHPLVPIIWGVAVKRCALPHLWMTSLPWRLAWCGTILLALTTASWFAYEKPLNGLKRFFPYSRAHPPPPEGYGGTSRTRRQKSDRG